MKLRTLTALLVYIVLANVPVWLAGWRFAFQLNGLFNVEYVLIGLLSFFITRVVTITLLLGAMLCDVAYNVGQTYMLSPADLLACQTSAPRFLVLHLGSALLVLLGLTMACALAWWGAAGALRPIDRRAAMATLLLFVAGCGVSDLMHQRINAASSDAMGGGVRLLRNSSHRILQNLVWTHRIAGITATAEHSMTAASTTLRPVVSVDRDASRHLAPNVVLILVESWGLGIDTRLNQALTAPYRNADLDRQYRMISGTVPFEGATVSGEMRELCSSSLGLQVLHAAAPALKDCLPAHMQSLGYRTTSVHGFLGSMFERDSWYRRIHFDRSWFMPQLRQQGLPVCPGPLPGICDASIASWIGGQLDVARGPQFLYWVTLNSHLPVPVENAVIDPPSCAAMPELADDALCAWYRLIFNVHRSVASLALREQSRPTIFLIVGDHAPPFATATRRRQFSYQVVPYLLLEPRSLEAPETTSPPVRSIAAHRPERHTLHHRLQHHRHPGDLAELASGMQTGG